MNRIFDTDNWREIGATLSRNKTRTFLTAFGIFWGTAMLAMLLGGAGGLRGMMMRNFAGVSTNMSAMFPQPTSISYRGFNKGSSWNMTERDIALIRSKIPEIEYCTGLVQTSGTTTYKDKTSSALISGASADFFKMQIPVLHSGRVYNESDFYGGKKVAVIGSNVASQLFGSEDPIGKYINAGGVYVQVIGVVSQRGEGSIGGRLDESVMIPATTLRRAWGLGDAVGFTVMTLRSGHRLSEVKDKIQSAICANHPISPDDKEAIGYMDIAEMFEQVEQVFLAISLLALFVGGGTLIAGIIGVGNIMWIIVKERTQEIGIRRAIGATPRDIIVQILSEGLVLTSVAGLAGISFATLVLGTVNHALYSPELGNAGFAMTFGTAVTILLTFMALGTLAGFIPAIKAMKIKPIEAINDK